MTIDARFAIAIAIMAVIAYGYRAVGFIIGTHLGEKPGLRRILDILPACAMGAVLGPSLATMTQGQAIAVSVSTLVFLVSSRFLLATAAGTAVLLYESWLLAPIT